MNSVGLEIFGKVQGVYFRLSTQKKAKELDLVGWVKNRSDGSVAAFAQGEEATLKKLIAWCHQGPPFARVERVDIQWSTREKEYTSFDIIRE